MASMFGTVDYIIFTIAVLASLFTGLYFGWKKGKKITTYDFILGSRKMAAFPVAMSLMASGESAIMMLGVPAEVYFYSAQMVIGTIGSFCGRVFTTLVLVPFIHNLKLTSSNKYLELRYRSPAMKKLACSIMLITIVQYVGIALLAPAIAIEAVMGLPYWSTIVTVAIAAIIYTACGGLKAVVWTDLLQGTVMYIGMIAFIIKGTIEAGGALYVFKTNFNSGRLDIFNFDFDPTVRHTFWGLFIGGCFGGTIYVFTQANVQRISSISNVKDAQRSYIVSAVAFVFIIALAVTEGLVIYAYYDSKRCDPLLSRKIKNINQILPYMVADIFKGIPGLPGLFIATLICASLSTVSTCLGSCSAIAWEDLIKPYTKNISESKAMTINRVLVLLTGLISMGIAFLLTSVQGTLYQIVRTFTASMDGSNYAFFILGCFIPWLNKFGAAGGGIVATALLSWVAIGQMFTDGLRQTPYLPPAPVDKCYSNISLVNVTHIDVYSSNYTDDMFNISNSTFMSHTPFSGEPVQGLAWLYSLSYRWIVPSCILIVFVVGSLISIATGRDKPGDVEYSLIHPVFDRLFCWCPSVSRKVLPCCSEYHIHNTSKDDWNCAEEREYSKQVLDYEEGERFNVRT